MDEYVLIKSKSNDSGDIILIKDYFMIRGKHYNFRDWYLKKSKNDISILTSDIISMEFMPYRSKKILLSFVTLTWFFIVFGRLLYRINSALMFMMILGSCILLILYICGKKKLLRITSNGITVAIDTRDYNKNQLEYIIQCWRKTFK